MLVTSQGTEVGEGAARLLMGQGPPEEGEGGDVALLATCTSSSSRGRLLLVRGVTTPMTTHVALNDPKPEPDVIGLINTKLSPIQVGQTATDGSICLREYGSAPEINIYGALLVLSLAGVGRNYVNVGEFEGRRHWSTTVCLGTDPLEPGHDAGDAVDHVVKEADGEVGRPAVDIGKRQQDEHAELRQKLLLPASSNPDSLVIFPMFLFSLELPLGE